MKKVFCSLLMSAALLGCAKTEKVKIGFIVKQPEVGWFQDEWRFADRAASEKGFEVVKLGGEDGEKVLAAIDSLAVQGAKGFIICTPDVKLGPAIMDKAKALNLKVMTVDDRFIDGNGNPLEDVHHMGISAYNIGKTMGEAIVGEVAKRGWDLKDPELAVLRVTYESLPTIMERIQGATDVLKENGAVKIVDARTKALTIADAFDAANVALTQNANIKKWIVYAGNDETAIGGVRAIEDRGLAVDNIIGAGINGDENAIGEFKKATPTGFMFSVLLSAKRHGYETAMNMYEWIANGTEPEKVIWTSGTTIDRSNYEAVMKDLGLL